MRAVRGKYGRKSAPARWCPGWAAVRAVRGKYGRKSAPARWCPGWAAVRAVRGKYGRKSAPARWCPGWAAMRAVRGKYGRKSAPARWCPGWAAVRAVRGKYGRKSAPARWCPRWGGQCLACGENKPGTGYPSERTKRRPNTRCCGCGSAGTTRCCGQSGQAEWTLRHDDLHHRSYERLGHERFGDLVAPNRSCHSEVHRRLESSESLWRLGRTTATDLIVRRMKLERMADRA